MADAPTSWSTSHHGPPGWRMMVQKSGAHCGQKSGPTAGKKITPPKYHPKEPEAFPGMAGSSTSSWVDVWSDEPRGPASRHVRHCLRLDRPSDLGCLGWGVSWIRVFRPLPPSGIDPCGPGGLLGWGLGRLGLVDPAGDLCEVHGACLLGPLWPIRGVRYPSPL